MPVSDTVNRSLTAASARLVDHDVGDHFTALRELDGVPYQIDQHLTQASRIAHERIGNVRSNPAGELEALCIRARRQQSNGILDDVAERERDLFERQLPRLDLREIENVVDERQKRLARLLDGVQIVALFLGEGGAERQVGHADDRVHRGPDLVAHVGEELALGDRRLLRPPLGALELTLRLLRVCDIPRHRMNQAEILVGDGLPLEPLVAAVGTPIAIVELRQLHVVHDRGPRADRRLAIVGVDEVQPRLRQQLLSRYPQRALPCGIQADEIPVKVGDAQQVPRQREEPVQFLLGPFPLDEQANLAADRRQHRAADRRRARGSRG